VCWFFFFGLLFGFERGALDRAFLGHFLAPVLLILVSSRLSSRVYEAWCIAVGRGQQIPCPCLNPMHYASYKPCRGEKRRRGLAFRRLVRWILVYVWRYIQIDLGFGLYMVSGGKVGYTIDGCALLILNATILQETPNDPPSNVLPLLIVCERPLLKSSRPFTPLHCSPPPPHSAPRPLPPASLASAPPVAAHPSTSCTPGTCAARHGCSSPR